MNLKSVEKLENSKVQLEIQVERMNSKKPWSSLTERTRAR